MKCPRCGFGHLGLGGSGFDPEIVGPCWQCYGRGVVCPRCKLPRVDTKRGYWHPACVEDHHLEKDQAHFRLRVGQRDRGVCALCRLDTVAMRKELDQLEGESSKAPLGTPARHALEARFHQLILVGWDRDSLLERILWEADHIIPRAKGGSPLGLKNGRTLCVPCHKGESARLAAELAVERRGRRDDGLVARRAE